MDWKPEPCTVNKKLGWWVHCSTSDTVFDTEGECQVTCDCLNAREKAYSAMKNALETICLGNDSPEGFRSLAHAALNLTQGAYNNG